MKIKKGDKIFDIFNYIFMIILVIVTLYPLWYVFIASVSDSNAVSVGAVTVKPIGINFDSYLYVFNTKNLWVSYANTVFYSFFGCLVSMILTSFGAYVISKDRLRGRKFFTLIIMITSWFGAGIMPTYINIRNLGLLNTRIGVLLHGAISTFYLILLKNYFEAVPKEMEESAKIDGASDFLIFRKIYLPLSVAALMTIALYCIVDRWNGYFWPMILLSDENKIPLQVLLKKLVVEMNMNFSETANIDYTSSTRETIVYATIVISTLPMVAVYPFIQKYFKKGVMVGAVKG